MRSRNWSCGFSSREGERGDAVYEFHVACNEQWRDSIAYNDQEANSRDCSRLFRPSTALFLLVRGAATAVPSSLAKERNSPKARESTVTGY